MVLAAVVPVVSAVVVLLAGCGANRPSAGSAPKPIRGTPVVAFYYPWYGTPSVSGAWRHWNNDGHDPTRRDPATGLPDIAGVDHPYPSLYDSTDPAVLRRQIAEAEKAGIDAFAVSWWGRGTFEDRAFARLMAVAAAEHADLRFTLYYEQVPNSDPKAAISDFTYIMSRYGKSPYFLRVGGRPVVFVYARAIFPGEFCLFGGCPAGSPLAIDWTSIDAYLHAHYRAVVYGDEGTTLLDLTGNLEKMGFDGIHEYNPQLDLKSEAPSTIYGKLAERGRTFHMAVADTVIPGYDDSVLGRKYPSVVPRDGGRLYTTLWKAAHAARPDVYLITTFNEWHEGTAIEPAYEWRNTYLDITADLAHS